MRNVYETSIGHFNPQTGNAAAAQLIDPKMRQSTDFPGWLQVLLLLLLLLVMEMAVAYCLKYLHTGAINPGATAGQGCAYVSAVTSR